MNFMQTFLRNNWKKIAIMLVVDAVMYYLLDRRKRKPSYWDGLEDLW